MSYRDYTFLGTTQSLCPECLALVPAKIIVRRGRVYFRKRCPTHGEREDYVSSDVASYDQLEYSLPARTPAQFGVEPRLGCPFDCGLCTEHEQHTCVGLVEITSACNLDCPMCFASSGRGGRHLEFEDCRRAIDRLVEVEGRPEILQLSGGEPTIHPEFERIFDYAIAQPIDYVMINTNGLRFAKDAALVERLAAHRERVEIYFQFDGFDDATSRALRGESLVDVKLRALDALDRAGLNVTLVATLQGGVNDHELGRLVKFGVERPHVTGLSLQPATYSGRHVLPEQLERRITFPDVIRGIAQQTDGMFVETDFMPLPCAHPNCHSLSIAYRRDGTVLPLARFIDGLENMDLLANGISFTRPRARQIIAQYLARASCCEGGCAGPPDESSSGTAMGEKLLSTIGLPGGATPSAAQFFAGTLAESIGARDLFRITITSFLDAYNFDVRRVMKCCTHHVLPSGHVVPFCAYNVLYREGHVMLPPLASPVDLESRGG